MSNTLEDKRSFNMMLTIEEQEALRKEAKRQGVTMTQILRMWIREVLMDKPVVMSK